MSDLDKFRTRWLRWLGQKTRCDGHAWVELLESNWVLWLEVVLDRFDIEVDLSLKNQNRETVKNYWSIAICKASMEDLIRLDDMYCTELIKKRGW